MRLPILILHIITGTTGMLSGFVAMILRKGSRRHGVAGNVFVVSMLTMSACGVWLAIMKSQPGNILGGTFTFYLVATAWMIARRKDGATSLFDWAGLWVVFSIAATQITFGLQAAASPTGLKYDYPPGPYFFLGSVASLAVIGDVRMLLRRTISAGGRLARHLWRMCFAQFIAASSIFLARAHLFPAVLRKTGTLFALSFLPIVVMIFWLIRVRSTHREKKRPLMAHGPQPSLSGS